jgi:DNA-binding NarL/FixJ family response regulator
VASSVTAPSLCFVSSDPLRLASTQQLLYLSGLRFHTRLVKVPLDAPLQLPAADVFMVDSPLHRSDTVELAMQVIQASRECPVLVACHEIEDGSAFAVLSTGVRGLLTYDELQAQLPSALQVVAKGGFWIPRTLLLRFLDSGIAAVRRSRFALARAELNDRDSVLLDALLSRYSDEQIASRLRLPLEDVQSGVTRVLQTFGVRRRDDLLLLAHQGAMAVYAD